MKKLLFSICLIFIVVGCAKKEVLITNEPMVQEESVETNVAEVSEPEVKEPLEDGTVVGSIFFDYDKFDIRRDMVEILEESVVKINENDEMLVVIEGNTDEFGSDEYNFALSNKRALATQNALVTRGVDKNRISTLSLGKTRPICTEKNEECYQKNRRGDIRLINK